jgi:hypothetical protein
MVHHFLRHIAQTLAGETAPWREQLAITPRGADFDLRDFEDGTSVLDKLAMTGDALAEALARGDAPDTVGQSILSHLQPQFYALIKGGQALSPAAVQTVIKPHGAALAQLHGGMSAVGHSVGELASVTTRGAASLDPDATRRILDRMRSVGDTTLRLLEDRIASSGTREEGKRLRGLRDDLKAWIEARNARVEQMQAAVDELNIRANALRNECLMQAKRLAAASALAAQGSGRRAVSVADGAEQASPEAMVVSAALRAFLLEAQSDITAPIRE